MANKKNFQEKYSLHFHAAYANTNNARENAFVIFESDSVHFYLYQENTELLLILAGRYRTKHFYLSLSQRIYHICVVSFPLLAWISSNTTKKTDNAQEIVVKKKTSNDASYKHTKQMYKSNVNALPSICISVVIHLYTSHAMQWYITQIDPINNSAKRDCEKTIMMFAWWRKRQKDVE